MARIKITGRDADTGEQREFQTGDEIDGMGAVAAHASTHITGGSDIIANAVPSVSAGLMSGADKAKLDGIDAGADVTGAELLNLLTVNEDLPIRRADAMARLPIGAEGNVLSVSGGQAAWAAPSGGGGAPKTPMDWYVDLYNGDDLSGDGSQGSPFKNPQAAINAAHAVDVANGSPAYTHHIHIVGDYYTDVVEPPAAPTVLIGADGPTDAESWQNDGVTYGYFILDGGNPYPMRDGKPGQPGLPWPTKTVLWGVAINNYESGPAGPDLLGSVELRGLTVEALMTADPGGVGWPAIMLLNGLLIVDGVQGFNQEFVDFPVISNGDRWDVSMMYEPWSGETAPWISEITMKNFYFESDADPPVMDVSLANLDGVTGRPSQCNIALQDGRFIHGGIGPALLATGGPWDQIEAALEESASTFESRNVDYEAPYSMRLPLGLIYAVSVNFFQTIKFVENHVIGPDGSGGDPEAYLVCHFTPSTRLVFDDNHIERFVMSEQPFPFSPGQNLVRVWTDAYVPLSGPGVIWLAAQVYWGKNYNLIPTLAPNAALMQYVQHEAYGVNSPSDAWWGQWLYIHPVVNRQMYQDGPGWIPPLVTIAASDSEMIIPLGNGVALATDLLLSGPLHEPLPFEIVMDDGGGTDFEGVQVRPWGTAPDAGGGIAYRWLNKFTTLQIANLDVANPHTYRIIMPGAMLYMGGVV